MGIRDELIGKRVGKWMYKWVIKGEFNIEVGRRVLFFLVVS